MLYHAPILLWLFGLVVLFSLGVREVFSSILGIALEPLFYITSLHIIFWLKINIFKIDFISFITCQTFYITEYPINSNNPRAFNYKLNVLPLSSKNITINW